MAHLFQDIIELLQTAQIGIIFLQDLTLIHIQENTDMLHQTINLHQLVIRLSEALIQPRQAGMFLQKTIIQINLPICQYRHIIETTSIKLLI